jgi:hypothetical protein
MRQSKKAAWFLLLFTVVTFGAVRAWGQDPSAKAPPANPRAVLQPSSKAASKTELTDAECRAFAGKIAAAARSGRVSDLNDLFDWDSLFNTMLKGIDTADKFRRDLTLGLKNGLSQETAFTGQIVKNSQLGGTFDFLHIRGDKKRPLILFRLVQPATAGGVAYFEFVPEKSVEGKVRAADLYVFSNGELLSGLLRRGVLPLIANENRGFLDKLLAGERDYVSDLPKLSETAQLVSDGKMTEFAG